MPLIQPASAADVSGIAEVLRESTLQTAAIEEHITHFLVARVSGEIVGCVALEPYETTGVLRSLAVVPGRRGQRLGTRLVEAVMSRARERGLNSVVLLTETARAFFEHELGFQVVSRDVVPLPARASWQFTGAVCQSATCMKREL